MQFSKEQIEKASSAASAEELLAMAKAEGIDLTEEVAKHYYDVLRVEALLEEQCDNLSEEELANVSGGSQCVDGSTYSSDPPYYLITTCYNRCRGYKEHHIQQHMFARKGTCSYCEYVTRGFGPSYCTIRNKYNDPYR